ncbi:MAG TPA: alpha/beta hydrolase fold domain-containing protein [Gemmataceae bacterium]|nr:alpha/beta hydrolase fold domain-containing protein [Gemmataceae bacterium]
MIIQRQLQILFVLVGAICSGTASAQEKPVVGLIPKAQRPITLDGNLDEWDGAFVTPVHVGHPDFANRGGQFLFLWDEENLYIGLRCLDQHPAHFGPDSQIWNGDAVEFYLDTRRGQQLGAAQFGPGTLHMFWTPFTKTDVKPRMGVRDLPAFKGFKLQGAEVAGAKTPWGYTAEFKLPWANFPNFAAKVGEVVGIECELCSSDGGPRVDRTFVYSSPAAVSTPSAFGRVRLVEKLEPQALKPLGRALLPLSLTKSANYAWLYGTVCLSPSIETSVAKLEGKIVDREGKVRKATLGSRKSLNGTSFTLWTGSWELFDLPPGIYTLELAALDKDGSVVTSRKEMLLHGDLPQAQARVPQPTHRDVHYGPHQRNVLDFWQAESKQPTPLLVSIHGGGFLGGDKSVDRQLLKECLESGISVAAITYRFSNQAIAPAPFQDSARAIQFLRFEAKEWNIDPKRIAATGGSAGAGISLWLGFHDDMADPKNDDPVLRQSTRLTCMVVFDGQTSYDPRFIRKLFPGKDTYKNPALAKLFGVDLNKLDELPAEKYRLFEDVSAINHLSKEDPPVLLIYSRPLDAEITNQGIGIHHALFGKVLKEKMDELGIPCEVVAGNQRIGGASPTRPIDFLKLHLAVKK